jgi:hypothetical protein
MSSGTSCSVALSLTSGPSLSGCSGPDDWPPTRYEDWELQDPAGQTVAVVRPDALPEGPPTSGRVRMRLLVIGGNDAGIAVAEP